MSIVEENIDHISVGTYELSGITVSVNYTSEWAMKEGFNAYHTTLRFQYYMPWGVYDLDLFGGHVRAYTSFTGTFLRFVPT